MTWLLWICTVSCLLALAAVGVSAYGARRWAGATSMLQSRLEAGRSDDKRAGPLSPKQYDARELEGLPAPVQRYFRAVLKDGQPMIDAVTIQMAGSFNMSATAGQWKPFKSQQRVITRRAGFLWDARIRLMPALTVRVVDSYIAGEGLLRAAIQGLFTMAEIRGAGEIARGEFMRYFAEAAWYPTALLPSQGVRWQSVDEHTANATIADGPLSLTLLFRFDDAGLMCSFRAESRGGMVGGKTVMAPWEGKWSNYQTCDGVRVPFTGEVAWIRAEGRKPYFVGSVTTMKFQFSP